MYEFLFDRYKSLTFDSSSSSSEIMDAPTIQPKFLAKGNELGLVAVGFSGGQASKPQPISLLTISDGNRSAKKA
jgi:hypothetical protein